MSKYFALPILAILAACSSEAENGEVAAENAFDTMTANSLIVPDGNSATAMNSTEATVSPPARTPEPEAAPAVRDAKRANEADAKQQNSSTSSRERTTKEEPEVQKTNAADLGTEAKSQNESCTAEHRAMGHC